MADENTPPKRWIIVKMLQGAIERTEAEIAELKAGGLFVRDAAGPDDTHAPPMAPATQQFTGTQLPTAEQKAAMMQDLAPPGAEPDDKE